MTVAEQLATFADELRKWWAFDDRQIHTHSWHTREDFIEGKLPELLADMTKELAELRVSYNWTCARLILIKSQRDELMAALDRAAPKKARELAKRFERESAS